MNSFLTVLGTVWVIWFFYRYYEFRWPEQYFGSEDKPNLFISTKPSRYFGFRVLPVFAITFVILGTLNKAGVNIFDSTVLGLLIGLLFSLVNDGRAIFDLVAKTRGIEVFLNKTSQYIIHILVFFSLTLVAMMAGFLSQVRELQWVLPKVDGLVDNIWAFFITVLISYFLYKILNKPQETSIDEAIFKSKENIDSKLVMYIEKTCADNKADPILVKAICIAENIERPKWIRKIENLFGIFKEKGSYGIMQVYSRRPLSDKESITRAVSKYFSGTATVDFEGKKKAVEKYNGNEKYVFLIEEIYRDLSPST